MSTTRKFVIGGEASLQEHIQVAGIVHWIAICHADEVKISCKNQDSPTIAELYADNPKIGVADENCRKIPPDWLIIPIKSLLHEPQTYNIHPTIRRIHSHINIKNTTTAENKWKELLHALFFQDYIVIYDEPAANKYIDQNYAKYMIHLHNHQSFPIVYLGEGRYNYPLISELNNPTHIRKIVAYNTILDLVTIMKHAKAVHMIDGPITAIHDYSAPTQQLKIMYAGEDPKNYMSNWICYTRPSNPYIDEP